MTYYISGPMSGIPDFNRNAFMACVGTLLRRTKGTSPFLPEDSRAHPNWTYRERA